ncbi:MAG: heat-inducible transcription repressor HrcA [Clostridia bacterium]|nr:heat-inducible transcription repressor HrcA [Clostridia bacterium]
MVLDERKLRILSAIIDDYVETASPVGSRTITRKYNMGVSPATIRNEMSDLEELGYLDQPHVSAGRVPSTKAYRLYVDMLLSGARRPIGEDREALQYFTERITQMEDVVQTAAQAVSELTHLTALVMMPGQPTMRIATLQLVPMPRGSALLVIVTDSGIVRDTVIRVSDQLDMDALYTISRMLTETLAGHTLREAQEMLDAYAARSTADQRVLMGVRNLAVQMARQSSVDSVSVDGTHHILNYPEYSDVEKARAFLSVMETRDKLLSVLRSGSGTVTVRIGSEVGLEELGDCSLVTAPFQLGGGFGSIGVLGPMRMPYDRVIRTLSTIGQAMTEIFGSEEIS